MQPKLGPLDTITGRLERLKTLEYSPSRRIDGPTNSLGRAKSEMSGTLSKWTMKFIDEPEQESIPNMPYDCANMMGESRFSNSAKLI